MTRPIEIDQHAIDYDLDSDDVDKIEQEHAAAGKPLLTFADYHWAFEAAFLNRLSKLVAKARQLLDEVKSKQIDVDAFRKRLEVQGWTQDFMNEYDLRYTKKDWCCELDAQYGMPEFKRLNAGAKGDDER